MTKSKNKKIKAKTEKIQRPDLLFKQTSCNKHKTHQSMTSDISSPRFNTGFNIYHKNLRQIMYRHWNIIRGDPTLGKRVPKYPQITFRRAKSMHQALVVNQPSTIKGSDWLKSDKGFIRCAKCKACKIGINTTSVATPFRKSTYTLRGTYTCKSEFAVYVLCCTCPKMYVGSTIHPVHVRILQHLRAINNDDPSYPVARHINQHHGGKTSDLSYFVIDTVPKNIRGGNRQLALRRLESKYIILLNTKIPYGLNPDEALSTHL